MIGGNIAEFELTDERGLQDFYNIIPESRKIGCEVRGTLDPVTYPDSSFCQAKQVIGLEPKQETFKDQELKDRYQRSGSVGRILYRLYVPKRANVNSINFPFHFPRRQT